MIRALASLLLAFALPAQALVSYVPCGPVGPWVQCGYHRVGPNWVGGVFSSGWASGGTMTVSLVSPWTSCHVGGPRVVALAGTFPSVPTVTIPASLTGNVDNTMVAPVWILPGRQYAPDLWRVTMPAPTGLIGLTFRYQWWLAWIDPFTGIQVAGSNCMDVAF